VRKFFIEPSCLDADLPLLEALLNGIMPSGDKFWKSIKF